MYMSGNAIRALSDFLTQSVCGLNNMNSLKSVYQCAFKLIIEGKKVHHELYLLLQWNAMRY